MGSAGSIGGSFRQFPAPPPAQACCGIGIPPGSDGWVLPVYFSTFHFPSLPLLQLMGWRRVQSWGGV